ncbi:hypothetical protein [Xylophilus sp.]|uniref:hypothetical protein n=1 Tax=Xylophilus sp. TaxID=2653893 RepID=UPI0013B7A122|nr:hypothetical protein [Xylophilus sp.]KAF1049352.1 MAG: hypothetical protein GAK38_00808 [Xylophilus sp.]
MTHFPRLRQQDLGGLVSRMGDAAQAACIRAWRETGRPTADLHAAVLLAAASLASIAREAGHLPTEAWAEANCIAQDPASLINTAPGIPAN